MHWYVTDETNTQDDARFFLYGGLVLTDEQVVEVHAAITRIRLQYGYRAGDSLKFQTSSRPAHVSIEDARSAKDDVLRALETIGVRMIVNVTHWGVGRGQGIETTTQWAINTVMWAYHRLLSAESAKGLVSVDRIEPAYGFAHLQGLFQTGLTFPTGAVSLTDRIVYFGMASNNASHLSSAVDIALGGFRYCVNAAAGVGKGDIAQQIFPTIARLLWSHRLNGKNYIGGYGLLMRPIDVRAHTYASECSDLRVALAGYANASADEQPEAGASVPTPTQ